MKATIFVVLIFCLMNMAGCANGGKYINARGVLDESISYSEKDNSNSKHPLTKINSNSATEKVVQVPQPALVDQNSIIEIHISKDKLKQGSSTELMTKQSEELLRRKTAITEALQLLVNVVQARQKTLETYQQKNLPQFYEAKKEAAKLELSLIAKLRPLWPNDSKEYSLLEDAYDPPSFGRLQVFLSDQIASTDKANKRIENDLNSHAHTLRLEAFLNSPEKEPVAVHLDGYDSLKEESLAQRDRFGLALSEEERKRLDAHVQKTQEMAAALEHLRAGESTLNESVQQVRSMILPQVSSLLDEGQRLQRRLNPATLAERTAETNRLFDAYILVIKEKNGTLYNSKKQMLEDDRKALLAGLPPEAKGFLEAVRNFETIATSFKEDWQKATPEAMVRLIDKAVSTVKSLQALRTKLPELTSDVQGKARETMERYLQDLTEAERMVLLKSDEAQALRGNLGEFYQDFRDVSNLIENATAAFSSLQLQPIAQMPSSTVSFQVPIENIKDTFINIEGTPRLPGDFIIVKATLKEGDKTLDTSVAKFEVERYGHYADLSPAVVLVKPDQLRGGDDGFRFAPVLSWMHHWYPRPENTGKAATVFRALDPAAGIHSAFTNFRADAASDSVQIGLGATVSFWMNRIQFGVGYNLMAKTRDEGQIYYFIGSDLIGLLQTIGIVKR